MYDPGNVFARILRGELPAHRVYENDAVVAILDAMPQSDGHTLILPRARAENLFDLDDTAAVATVRAAKVIAAGLRQAFRPDGITLMQFNGAAAGQTVFHFHLHLIPRYENRPLRSHGRNPADPAVLADQAERLRQALASP